MDARALDSVAHRILQLMGSEAVQETIFRWGVVEEFEGLQNTMNALRKVFGNDSGFEGCDLVALEDVLYYTDDLLDDLHTVALGRRRFTKKVHAFFSTSSNPLVFKFKMVDEIKKVRERLIQTGFNPSEQDREEPVARQRRTKNPRETHSYVPEQVIGRDVEKEEIIVQLLEHNPEEDVVVISIVGVGGLGKTALAQLIFNDVTVQNHFDLRIWVVVGEEFGLKEIMIRILLSFTTHYSEFDSYERLQSVVRRELQGKRYLLVLDDVWGEDKNIWNKLIDLLSVGANGSRIIITTRSTTVAMRASKKQLHHNLKPLDEDASWNLFRGVAFEQGQQPISLEIMKIGEEIVKRCGGLPLATITMGGMFFSEDPKTWQQVLNELQLPMISQDQGNIVDSLKLSYDSLPFHLKHCFAYCRLFPKDYEIDVQALINMWMSQGLIWHSHGNDSLEDSGYTYILDLLRRSFLQETKSDEFRNITKCKMQNLMHDLAISVAGSAFETLRLKGEEIGRKPHHISFDFHLESSWQIPVSFSKLERIRSLILPRQSRWEIEGRSSESVCDAITKLKFLRMLDLHNSGIKVVPNSIGELKHLRYLDLSRNVSIKALPNSISRLPNLQTLKINHCSNLQTLPRDIEKLVNLRNLENESCCSLTHMPRGLRQLFDLRTLSEFVLSKEGSSSPVSKQSGKLDELGDLNDLRGKLEIKHLTSPSRDMTAGARLYKKRHLVSLTLIWDSNATTAACEMSLEDLRPHPRLRELSLSAYAGVNFSTWLPCLENLVKLSLTRCMKCERLPQLDHLPHLEELVVEEFDELKYISNPEEIFRIHESTPFFPSLKKVRLTNLPKLEKWRKHTRGNVEETTFSCLSKLIVEDCPNLTSMPMFPYLEELMLKKTSWEPFKRNIEAATRSIPSASEASSSSSSSTVVSLSKLRTLCVIQMSNADFSDMWRFLPSLHSLTFDQLANIKTFLQGLELVTSLQQLLIWRCNNLEEISSWIKDLKSLKTLSIRLCPNLEIPPDSISLITSLQKVEIENCPKISHIERMLKDRLYKK